MNVDREDNPIGIALENLKKAKTHLEADKKRLQHEAKVLGECLELFDTVIKIMKENSHEEWSRSETGIRNLARMLNYLYKNLKTEDTDIVSCFIWRENFDPGYYGIGQKGPDETQPYWKLGEIFPDGLETIFGKEMSKQIKDRANAGAVEIELTATFK
ncbi:MAG: hypothetical protein ACE5JS_16280 [Nitrospinota bacterium]